MLRTAGPVCNREARGNSVASSPAARAVRSRARPRAGGASARSAPQTKVRNGKFSQNAALVRSLKRPSRVHFRVLMPRLSAVQSSDPAFGAKYRRKRHLSALQL
eukprot:IDg20744t1